jgi:UDP-glucose 4-epimerase
MAVCLVNGGAGFLGSHLVEALLERGHRVRVLDDLSTGRLANLAGALGRVELILGDLADLKTVRRATEGVERVFHLAPPVRARGAAPPGAELFDAGALQVLIAARDSLVQRVIYASSLHIYGHAPQAPLSESDPASPVSDYAAAQLSGEQDCVAFTHLYGLETVRLRYSPLFGPRQGSSHRCGSLVPRLVRAHLAGQRPLLPEDGRRPQDLLYVEDAVRAALLAAEAPEASGQVFNIGRGEPVTPLELATLLPDCKGGRPPPLPGGPPLPAEFNNRADISRAQARLRFRPEADLGAGLARCVEFHRRRGARDPRKRRWGVLDGA